MLQIFYEYLSGNCSDGPYFLVHIHYEFKSSNRLVTKSHFTVKMARCKRIFYAISFYSRTSRLGKHVWLFDFYSTLSIRNLKAYKWLSSFFKFSVHLLFSLHKKKSANFQLERDFVAVP